MYVSEQSKSIGPSRLNCLFLGLLCSGFVRLEHARAVVLLEPSGNDSTFSAELKLVGPLMSSPYQTGRSQRGISPFDSSYMRKVARLDPDAFEDLAFTKVIPGLKAIADEMARLHRVANGTEEFVPLTPTERAKRIQSIDESFRAGFGDAANRVRHAECGGCYFGLRSFLDQQQQWLSL